MSCGCEGEEPWAIISARIARTGVQPYPDALEYRPPEEVFHPDSLATFVGLPVVLDHDWVHDYNVESRAVGFVRSVSRDGDHVLAEIALFDADVIERVNSGDLVEFSVGYWSDTIPTPNAHYTHKQTEIRANHLAIGRYGWARCGTSCSVVEKSCGCGSKVPAHLEIYGTEYGPRFRDVDDVKTDGRGGSLQRAIERRAREDAEGSRSGPPTGALHFKC